MGQLSITPVSARDADTLAALAKSIWTEHYTPIIGAEQVAYMTARFQSAAAVREQMAHENYRYYFLDWDGVHAGYLGIQPENGALYLSKLYVDRAFRGRHIAAQAFSFLKELCGKEGLSRIWLTVNKYNSGSIAAYEALGLARTRSQTADIGGGYVMDDYIYEYAVSNERGGVPLEL